LWNAVQQKGTEFLIRQWFFAVRFEFTDISKTQSADGIHWLPEIWGKVNHMAGDYTEGM
jgi:hypothetical protein